MIVNTGIARTLEEMILECAMVMDSVLLLMCVDASTIILDLSAKTYVEEVADAALQLLEVVTRRTKGYLNNNLCIYHNKILYSFVNIHSSNNVSVRY
jgi:hypothetical protein